MWNVYDYPKMMRHIMEKAFEDLPHRTEEGSGRLTRPAWVPAVDAWEDENNFYLDLDIPGVEKEKVNIKIEEDQLVISGERTYDDNIKYLRKERVYGPFVRAFTLESPIEREKVKAIFKNGVLKITLPKKEEVKPKTIQIEVIE